jgi:hypothetical protein
MISWRQTISIHGYVLNHLALLRNALLLFATVVPRLISAVESIGDESRLVWFNAMILELTPFLLLRNLLLRKIAGELPPIRPQSRS